MYFSSGFILMIKLFASGGSKIIVGLIVMIVIFCFAILALVDGLLLIKVRHKKLISIRCDIFKKGLFNFDMYIILCFFESSGITGISLMKDNTKVVGIMMIVLGVLWALISFATIVLTIRVLSWLPLFE